MQISTLKISELIAGIILTIFFVTGVLSQTTDVKTSNEKNTQPAIVSQSKNTNDLIHIGDLIDVDVVGSTEYDWRGTLTPEGFLDGINFTAEPIYGLCQTVEKVASEVAKGYEKILRNPQVVVKIIDRSHRPVSLLYGAVKIPQRFLIKRQVRLNELLILSGGLTDKTSGEIQILRSPELSCSAKKSSSQPEKVKSETVNSAAVKQDDSPQLINIKISELLKGQPEANPLIMTGDVVTVAESKPIYVTGGVVNPKKINARSQISVSRAIAAAGGLTKNADPKAVTVFRTENKETKIIEVDLDRIKSGQAEDVALKALDIVEVAQKGRKKGKYVPFSADLEEDKPNLQNLPLRVID